MKLWNQFLPTGLVLFLSIFVPSAMAQDQISPLLFPPPNNQAVQIQAEQLLERLERAQEQGLAFNELLQVMRQLQLFRAPEEALAAYQRLLDTPEMQKPENRFQQMIQMGRFLEQAGQPGQAVELYQNFLQWLDSDEGNMIRAYREHVRSMLLSAMLRDGQYRQARQMAGEILAATEEPLSPSIMGSLLDLAENDFILGEALTQIEEAVFESSRLQGYLPRVLRLYVQQGRAEKAAEVADRMLREKPSAFLSSIDLAYEVYEEAEEGRPTERVFSILDSLIQKEKNNSLLVLIRVRWLDRAGRTEEAISILEKQPDSSGLFQRELANLYLAGEEYEKASNVFMNLLRMQPDNMELLRQLGHCWFESGRKNDAIRIWKEIPPRLNRSAQSYMELADIFQQHGLYSEAIETLKQGRKKFGPAVDMQIEERILDLWIDQEKWDRLIRQYLTFSLENGSGEIRYRRRLTEQAASPERALKIFSAVEDRLADEVDSIRRKYLNQLGSDLLLEAGQARRAVDFVTESFKGSNEIGIRLYTLGTELENRGEVDLALEAWSRAPEGVAFYHQARFQMATTSLQEEEYDKARLGALGLIDYMAKRYVPALASTSQSATLSACLNRLQGHNRQTFQKALMILAEVDLAQKNPGRALSWINVLKEQPTPGDEGRLKLLEGHAYSQLGSLDMAEEAYHQAHEEAPQGSAAASEAGYFLAECFLWREKTPEALNAYFDLAQGAPEAPFSNEAIRRYMVLSFAGAEQLYQYSLATLFEWKGDNEEAIRLYREAASHESDREIGGWCLFEAARLLHQTGQVEAAQKQVDFIIENYEHPTLLAECRVLLAQMSDTGQIPAPENVEEATGPYAALLMQHPDTLYSDLARLKMEGRLEEPF